LATLISSAMVACIVHNVATVQFYKDITQCSSMTLYERLHEQSADRVAQRVTFGHRNRAEEQGLTEVLFTMTCSIRRLVPPHRSMQYVTVLRTCKELRYVLDGQHVLTSTRN
jgi:hypothetical protein